MEEDLRREVENLVEDMDRDVEAVIVEGRNDMEALEKAGFSGEVYTCSENSEGVVSLAREAGRKHGSIAVLTDYDSEGRELNARIMSVLPESKVRKIWRKKLGKILTGKGRRDIESINNILE